MIMLFSFFSFFCLTRLFHLSSNSLFQHCSALQRTTATAHVFLALIRFLELRLDFNRSFNLFNYVVFTFSFISLCMISLSSNMPKYL